MSPFVTFTPVYLDSYKLEMLYASLGPTHWVDKTVDLTDEPIIYEYGIKSWRPDAWIADTGTCSFGMRNDAGNSGGVVGYHSPYSPAKQAGFDFGVLFRLTFTYAGVPYLWAGRLNVIDAVPGSYGDLVTHCVAFDWIDEAKRAPLTLALQQNQRADQVFTALVGNVPLGPLTTAAAVSADTLVFALDTIPQNATVFDGLKVLANNEVAVIAQKRNSVNGQTVFFEARGTRTATIVSAVTLDDTQIEDPLDIPGARGEVINHVRVTVHPRRTDTGATTVVANLDAGSTGGVAVPEIPANGGSVTIWLNYTDPSNRSNKIGAYNVVNPLIPTTDWLVNRFADGSGSDLTGSCTVVMTVYASGVKLVITNNATEAGHLTRMLIHGDGIYALNPVTVEGSNASSIATYGDNFVNLDCGFTIDPVLGQRIANWIATGYGTPAPPVRAVTFLANGSDALMLAALQSDISTRVTLSETVQGFSRDFFINAVRHELTETGLFWCTWLLTPSTQSAFFQLGVTGSDALASTARLGYF